jgi:hypothetical protein
VAAPIGFDFFSLFRAALFGHRNYVLFVFGKEPAALRGIARAAKPSPRPYKAFRPVLTRD